MNNAMTREPVKPSALGGPGAGTRQLVPRERLCRHSGPGFQLLDLALTFLLMALLLSVAVPFLNQLASAQKKGAACDQLVSALSKARSLAVSENLRVQLIAEPPDRYAISAVGRRDGLIWRKLPRGVRFAQIPRRPVTFHSRGTAAPGGTFRLAGGPTIIVAVSGRIRWSRN